MKLMAHLKLQPAPEQANSLKRTLQTANAACNDISGVARQTRMFSKFALQKVCYQDVRDMFGLSAQMVVRALAKVGDAYKWDQQTKRTFRSLTAIAYDDRILSFALLASSVSIWTLDGRQSMRFVCGERQRRMLQTWQGESDLLFHRGAWYLLVTCEVEEADPQDVDDLLGIDLGVRKSQRTILHSWSFAQFLAFVIYKAQLVGVPVVLVDPRNISCTCPACGHIDKANRPSRAVFRCTSCGCAGHADLIATENIRVLGRAAVMQPYVSEAAPPSRQRQAHSR